MTQGTLTPPITEAKPAVIVEQLTTIASKQNTPSATSYKTKSQLHQARLKSQLSLQEKSHQS